MKIISLGSGTIGITRVKISGGISQSSFIERTENGILILEKLKSSTSSEDIIWEDEISEFSWTDEKDDFSWKTN